MNDNHLIEARKSHTPQAVTPAFLFFHVDHRRDKHDLSYIFLMLLSSFLFCIMVEWISMKGSENTMILYFTGTGNSEYTARRIAKEPGGKICNLFTKMLVNGKPHWGNKCTHCMTCICRCSQKVIEYGKHSQELNRYTCPK